MLQPFAVRLYRHDPAWAELAMIEAERVKAVAGPIQLDVHHIGSTSVAGIVAKPILDLLGVAPSLKLLDTLRPRIEALGYAWHGENGLSNRRYCTLSDPDGGRRRVQLHCYARGDEAIRRHLAFRNFLRMHPHRAAEYEREKLRCAGLHPNDSHAYSDCKDAWIKRTVAEALASE